MKTVRDAVGGIVVLALVLGAGVCLDIGRGARGAMAPRVAYTRLDGSRSTSDQWRGKVVLVNFWATTCEICIHEMPAMIATHQMFKQRGFDTLAVAMSYDPPAYVMRYAETRKLPFDVAIDNTGAIANSFGEVQLTPTSVLIDKHGQIVKRYLGEPDFVALHRLVEKLLSES